MTGILLNMGTSPVDPGAIGVAGATAVPLTFRTRLALRAAFRSALGARFAGLGVLTPGS